MANKELTARVRFDTKDAESKLKRLEGLIKSINKAVTGNANTSKLESTLGKQVIQAEKVTQATIKTKIAQEKLSQEIGKTFVQEELVTQALNKTAVSQEKVKQATIGTKTATQKLIAQHARTQSIIERIRASKEKVKQKTGEIANKSKQWTASLKTNNSLLGSVGSKLKRLASTYLGIMGMKATITTSDVITSTQNRLNSLNGGDTNATQEQMDKMYASANKVRMAYTDMMSNASKSMTLAGDAFQGNMDNAIRFQEIMAETYTLGGASAEEMSTSMYQMIQALGAGTLAGDELRSVREGAPLAYKEIEKFAQGIYNTTDSLKDMASQGKISSEMVVAAIMGAGDKIDAKFAETSMTFGQAWDRIKNSAVKAFEPVSNALNKMLNKAAENGAFEKIEQAFWNISKALQIAFRVIEISIQWIADNWGWLKYVIVGALILIGSYFIVTGAIALASAIKAAIGWIILNWQMLLVVAAIALLIYGFYLFQQGVITACDLAVMALMAVAIVMFLIFGWQVALVFAIIALAIWLFEEICGIVGFLAAVIVDIISFIWNIIVYVVQAIAAGVAAVIAFIVNLVMGCGKSIGAICENIGIAFSNAWTWAKNTFWEFIADVLRGVSKLEPVINGIAGLLGKDGVDFGGLISAAESKKGTYKDYVSVGDAWYSGWHTADDWASNTWNFVGKAHTGYADPLDWGSAAYDWGSGVKASVNQWGSQFQNDPSKKTSDKSSWLDNLGKELGLDFGGMTGADGFPSADNPKYDTGGAYNSPNADDMIKNALGDISDDTGSIADSMKLSEDDLEYLRKIAEMEWKKEYTTASIKVDMSNYNTVNGDGDIDGIVTKLADKLYEEMNIVANGVYA